MFNFAWGKNRERHMETTRWVELAAGIVVAALASIVLLVAADGMLCDTVRAHTEVQRADGF